MHKLCLPKKKYFLLPHGDFTHAFFFPYKILNEAIYKGLGLGLVENDPPKVVHYRPLDPQNASQNAPNAKREFLHPFTWINH